MKILSLNSKSIKQAVDILNNGGLVAMPTETVYGLAADARNGKAVAKIFVAKGRPQFNPLIVHVNEVEDIAQFAYMNEKDLILADKFWPAPLTMILKRKDNGFLSDLVSAGLDSVAVRIPAHKGARELIRECSFPLAAPSANKSGSLSPTTPAHVAKSLGDNVDLILAGGFCKVGLESTVVDCTGEKPYILRPGGIGSDEISQALGQGVSYDLGDKGGKVKSPGQLLKHYSPSVPIRLNAVDLNDGEALLGFGALRFMATKSGVLASDLPDDMVCNLSEQGDLYEAAANLFAMLNSLDNPKYNGIAVMNIPDKGIGVAINDRLKRAAQS